MLKRHARAACTALATAGLLLAATGGAAASDAPRPAAASAAETLRTADAQPENCSSGGTTFFQPLNPILSATGSP